MELFLSIAAGIGLSAACGFRVFLPFAVMSIAAMSGNLDLSDGFQWIGSYPALITFLTATLFEVVAYYIPWVDNLLDTVATPSAVVAGAIASASVFTDMSPWMTWTLVAIAGGTAGMIQTGSVLLRGASSASTGGLGNVVVASAELASSTATAIAAIAIPIVTLVAIIFFVFFVITKLVRRTGRWMTRNRQQLVV